MQIVCLADVFDTRMSVTEGLKKRNVTQLKKQNYKWAKCVTIVVKRVVIMEEIVQIKNIVYYVNQMIMIVVVKIISVFIKQDYQYYYVYLKSK